VGGITAQYGKNFHARVISAVPPHCAYPTDFAVPFTEIGDLLSQHVGIALITRAVSTGMLVLASNDKKYLEKELRADRCTVQYYDTSRGGHQLHLVVFVTNIRVWQADGTMLFQIGSWESGKGFKKACHVPGTKRSIGESPQKALQRILNEDLRPFADHIELEGMPESVEEWKEETQNLRMPTKTVKTVHSAFLYTSVEAIQVSVAVIRPPPLNTVNEGSEAGSHLDTARVENSLTNPGCTGSEGSSEELLAKHIPEFETIFPRDILILQSHKAKSFSLYAFLTPEEYDIVDRDDNTVALKRWLACVAVGDAGPFDSATYEPSIVTSFIPICEVTSELPP